MPDYFFLNILQEQVTNVVYSPFSISPLPFKGHKSLLTLNNAYLLPITDCLYNFLTFSLDQLAL